MIEQGALLGIAFGHVETDQAVIVQLCGHGRRGQHFALDHLAADAPVGIPVQQQGLAGSLGTGQGLGQVAGGAQ